jgi:hypothetical protein
VFTTTTLAKIGDDIELEAYALYYTITQNPEAYANLAEGEDKEKLKKAINEQTMAILTAAEKIKKELHAAKKEGGFWLLLLLFSIHSLKNDL